MNLRYFERRTEVVRAYVRAENGCEETNHFVKPSAIELARIAEARNGRKKFDVFVKPNGQSRACASYAMARKRLLMGDLLEEFFARPYVAAKVAEGRLPDTWREVVGDAVANLTTDLRLENRILYVRLQSSVVRQELFYQREALRDRINEVSKVRLVNAVIVK